MNQINIENSMDAIEGINSLRPARFAEVRSGTFFKETPSGAWMLRIEGGRGLWRDRGVESAPRFEDEDVVFVEGSNLMRA
jgi:hypothetical protein